MTWTVTEPTSHIERYIVTAMIVSDECLKKLIPIQPHLYLTTDFSVTVSKWCVSYYEKYQRAPGADIQTIYEAARRNGLRTDQSVLIGQFLSSLAQEYETAEQFNSQHAIDQSVNYFKERSLWQIYDQLGKSLQAGDLLKAQAAVSGYKELAISHTLGCEPLIDIKVIQSAFSERNELFKLPGALGSLLGAFEREWLMAVIAPYKVGKTFTMLEIAKQALASHLNVAWFNLEMGEGKMVQRLVQSLSSLPHRTPKPSACFMPVWDCVLNQIDTCSRPERTGHGSLRKEGEIGLYASNPHWVPCQACHGFHDSDYQTDSWIIAKEFDLLTWRRAWAKAQAVAAHLMGTRFKLQSWPKFSAKISDIPEVLHIWEDLDGFIADVIVVDQPSAAKPGGSEEGRHIPDRQWKELGGLSQQKHAFVIAASQSGGKDTLELKSLRERDVGEDSRILGHVDLTMVKNQTGLEKKLHRARIASTVSRSEDFNITDEVMILQQLALGQACLDSRFIDPTMERNYLKEKKFV